MEVEFVSECATGNVGDMIVDTLRKNGVGVKSVDRFTEGQSAECPLIFRDKEGNERFSEYVKYPDSRFDVLWPKIEENDIVVFGSFSLWRKACASRSLNCWRMLRTARR